MRGERRKSESGSSIRGRVEQLERRDMLSAIPLLSSNPDSPNKIFLDFDGHVVTDNYWAEQNLDEPIHARAYDIDGNDYDATGALRPDAFGADELAYIELAWRQMSEDFAPFDVDVTTFEPPASYFTETQSGQPTAHRVLFTSNYDDDEHHPGTGNFWASGNGVDPWSGVAEFDSWFGSSDSPAFVFANGFNGTSRANWIHPDDTNIGEDWGPVQEYIGLVGSHEMGHVMDLRHDGVTSRSAAVNAYLGDPANGYNGDTEYYGGHTTGATDAPTSWGAIMGGSELRSLTQWSQGDYAGASNAFEDDLAIIASQFRDYTDPTSTGYRTDDHEGTITSGVLDPTDATPLALVDGFVTDSGIIERSSSTTNDYDVFEIDLGSTPVDAAIRIDTPAPVMVRAGTGSDVGVEGNFVGVSNLDVEMRIYREGDLNSPIHTTISDNSTNAAHTIVNGSGKYYVVVDGVGYIPSIGADYGYSDYGSLGQYTVGVRLTAPTPNPLGDYNRDGTVDSSDYTVWRDTLGGQVGYYFGADGSGNGMIDQPDYQVWRANFGATASSTPAGLAVVPGDYNVDGTVDQNDYNLWQQDFGSTTNLAADGNGNGIVDQADLEIWQENYGLTTLEDIAGDFDGNGVVDTADYDLWVAGDQLADADGDGDVDSDDYDIWDTNFGMTSAALAPLVINGGGGIPFEVPMAAPQVVGVRMSGSNSTHAEFDVGALAGTGAQLGTIPVGGLDTVSLQFSEEVFVTQNALTLTNLSGWAVPTVNAFTYDLATQTASWTFDGLLPIGQYELDLSDSVYDLDRDALDGEFTNPWSLAEAAGFASTLPSGNGVEGGQFDFRFTVLSADFERTSSPNVVGTFDVSTVSANWLMTGATHAHGDATGEGTVDGSDLNIVSGQYGIDYTVWPSVTTDTVLVSTLNDEDDADTSYGDLSLREALTIVDNNPLFRTISFDPALFASGAATLLLADVGGTSAIDEIVVDTDVEIVGPGVDLLTLSGGNAARVIRAHAGNTVTIAGLTIADGYSTGNGGGILNEADLTLEYVTIRDNQVSAASPNGWGGGIHSSASDLTIIGSTIADNTASDNGGGISFKTNTGTSHNLWIENSTIANNLSTGGGRGGGLYIYHFASTPASVATILNSTFSGNEANIGGSIGTNGYPTINILASTITDNHARQSAGGLYNNDSSSTGADITVHFSIIAGNTGAGWFGSWDVNGPLNSASSYNLIGNAAGSGIVNGVNGNIVIGSADPGLTALGDYGGPTQTHALLDGSLAIAAGDAAFAELLGIDTDQRGVERDGDLYIDLGAFELAADEYYGTM